MPWYEESVMSQRLRLVEQLLLPNANITDICRSFKVSRKTAYKWLLRYNKGGPEALEGLSKRPHNQPDKTNKNIEEHIVDIHKDNPYWGPRKLRDYLLHIEGMSNVPAHTTVSRILKRNNCQIITNNKSGPATIRFERKEPNDLWQMDFKGSFMTGQYRCYPLTILDDCSRFSITLKACENETGETVKNQLIAVFKEFGLPEQINVDNGNPWGSADLNSYASLQVWLMRYGIRVTHSAPYHPQTNGKDERFHRTLKLEVLHQRSYTKANIQKALDDWRHMYNYKRPHEALGGKPPGQQYHTSSRVFSNKLPELEYEDAIVRKVHDTTGTFRFKGMRFRAGKGFANQRIAIKETDQADEFSIFFMDNFIKKFKLEHGMR